MHFVALSLKPTEYYWRNIYYHILYLHSFFLFKAKSFSKTAGHDIAHICSCLGLFQLWINTVQSETHWLNQQTFANSGTRKVCSDRMQRTCLPCVFYASLTSGPFVFLGPKLFNCSLAVSQLALNTPTRYVGMCRVCSCTVQPLTKLSRNFCLFCYFPTVSPCSSCLSCTFIKQIHKAPGYMQILGSFHWLNMHSQCL